MNCYLQTGERYFPSVINETPEATTEIDRDSVRNICMSSYPE
jgi:hypothetical protein